MIRHPHSQARLTFEDSRGLSPSSGKWRLEDAIFILLSPALVTAFFWLTSVRDISLLQAGCAWALLCFPIIGFLSWKRQKSYTASLFAFVSAIYWVYYGVALFYGERGSPAMWGGLVSDEAITQSMLMAVLGVTCLWVGMQTPIGRLGIPKHIPDIPLNPSHWNYVRVLLVLGLFFSVLSGAANILGEGGRQLIYGLQSTVPLIAFLILFRHYLAGKASRLDKILLGIFLFGSIIVGISSGWIGAVLPVVLGCLIVYLQEKRRIPWLAILLGFFCLMFLQAGKGEFRAQNWHGEGEGGKIEKVEQWFSFSFEAWQDALNDSTGQKGVRLFTDVIMRTSLLTQTANVVEQTPSSTPYQGGSTYSYLAAMWIPRAFWPGKPTASEANQFYQVAYGLTPSDRLGAVSISSGAMTEAYINFGWWGVVLVMYGIGLLFNWVQRIFLVRQSGWLFGAIGVMLILNFINIEAQLAMYVGGIAQRTLLLIIVFLPILNWRKLE